MSKERILAKEAYEDLTDDYNFYSNANYILLGLLVEAIAKEPLEKVMKEYLFDSLNMSHISMDSPVSSNTKIARSRSVEGSYWNADIMYSITIRKEGKEYALTLSGTEQTSNPMGLIRIDNLKIRLRPSSAKFTINYT
jgi:hypothetical protein